MSIIIFKAFLSHANVPVYKQLETARKPPFSRCIRVNSLLTGRSMPTVKMGPSPLVPCSHFKNINIPVRMMPNQQNAVKPFERGFLLKPAQPTEQEKERRRQSRASQQRARRQKEPDGVRAARVQQNKNSHREQRASETLPTHQARN
jgi:hypothetical protein